MKHLRIATPVQKPAVWLAMTLACLLSLNRLSAQESKLRSTFLVQTEEVRCVAFSPDGKSLASGSDDNLIRLWDVASEKVQVVLRNTAVNGVASLAFSPDGKTLASGTVNNTIILWDVGARTAVAVLNNDSQGISPKVVFSLDGKTIASGGTCISDMKVWDLATRKNISTLKGHARWCPGHGFHGGRQGPGLSRL